MREISTKRCVSPGAEDLIGVVHKVLDQGEVELIEYIGTDVYLARVARVSTGSERQDLGILPFLIRHRHSSPIEFAQVVLRVKLPIFVDRQWRRHRAASLTEADGQSELVKTKRSGLMLRMSAISATKRRFPP